MMDPLTRDGGRVTAADIAPYLQGGAKNLRLEVYEQVDSTNRVVQELAAQGAPEGTAVLAWTQTAGRGRRGRRFFSPPGTGLYLSLLLRPRALSPVDAALITSAAAVAVSLAIEEVSPHKAGIKWVNDVWIGERKVCGILVEGSFTPGMRGLDYAALGMGVNLIPPPGGFPPELEQVAGAVFTPETITPESKSRLAAGIVNHFLAFYHQLPDTAFLEAYRARSFLLGRPVTVSRGNEIREAVALDLDGACRLLVRYGDGREEWLDSGEVSAKPR